MPINLLVELSRARLSSLKCEVVIYDERLYSVQETIYAVHGSKLGDTNKRNTSKSARVKLAHGCMFRSLNIQNDVEMYRKECKSVLGCIQTC